MISVIFVQHNNTNLTVGAVASFKKYHPREVEIIVVDNASTELQEVALKNGLNGVNFIQNEQNVGFGAANNIAAMKAKGDVLLFLNNDTICQAEILRPVLDRFGADPTIGVIGPKLLNQDGSFQLSAGWLPSFWREIGDKAAYGLLRQKLRFWEHGIENYFRAPKKVGWVTGAALFIRKNLFEKLGGFDEDLFMYFEDKDICLRVWNEGHTVVYDPTVSVIHLKGGSSSSESPDSIRQIYRRSQMAYYAKHRPGAEQLLLRAYLGLIGERPGA